MWHAVSQLQTTPLWQGAPAVGVTAGNFPAGEKIVHVTGEPSAASFGSAKMELHGGF